MTFEYCAFFDLDETLIRTKSMLSFAEYFFVRSEEGPRDPAQLVAIRKILAEGGSSSREQANRLYYSSFAGWATSKLTRAGLAWFQRVRPEGLFIVSSCRELTRHKQAGAEIVLVSGSFHPVVDPIADELGVHIVYCTELVENNGVCTGELRAPMIGESKAHAVRAHLTRRAYAPEKCFAYGDHGSDLTMLELVGYPVVVGRDPTLVSEAARRSWRVLPSSTITCRGYHG